MGNTNQVCEGGASFDYPFLDDNATVRYISESRVIFFLRGLPGSGKSTLAQAIYDRYPGKAVICSSQGYLPAEQKHPFPKELLQQCHEKCEECVRDNCKSGIPVVIVDNSNLTLWEVEKYGNISREYNYTGILVEPQTSWLRNPEELAKKSSRGVPEETIRAKLAKFETTLFPLFYGWFVNHSDSVSVRSNIGQVFYDRCLENAQFYEEFSKFLLPEPNGTKPDPHHYFSSETYDVGPVMLHCTAFFSNHGKISQSQEYYEREAVQKGNGRAYTLTIIGLLVTPRSLGIRLKLNDEELPLWYQEDTLTNEDDSQTTAHVTKSSQDAKNNDCIISKFSPTCGNGSRAHFSLGSGPGVQPVQTGLDLVQLIELEQEAAKTGKGDQYLTISVEGGVARCYDNGNWMVYFDEPVTVEALFSGFF